MEVDNIALDLDILDHAAADIEDCADFAEVFELDLEVAGHKVGVDTRHNIALAILDNLPLVHMHKHFDSVASSRMALSLVGLESEHIQEHSKIDYNLVLADLFFVVVD